MNIFQAVILGVLQGLTEFLPVSSSGHLILVPSLLGWELQSLAFDTVLHLGTATALIVYFHRDLIEVVKNKKYLKLVAVGTIPAVLAGLFLEDFIEGSMRSSAYVTAFLLVGSLIMWLAERTYKKVWHEERISEPTELKLNKGMVIGVFQSLALFSGISRSGSTISGGMFSGLTRGSAAKFSFILSIPIVIAAVVFKVADSAGELSFDIVLLAGFLTSTITGLLAIKWLLKFLEKNTLHTFLVYRIVLALIVILTLI